MRALFGTGVINKNLRLANMLGDMEAAWVLVARGVFAEVLSVGWMVKYGNA